MPGIHPLPTSTAPYELVHLHVGRAAEADACHGPTFKRTLSEAMREGYAITIRSTLHGTYAEAIERDRKHPLEEGFPRSR